LRSAIGLLDWGGPIGFEGVRSIGSGVRLTADEDDGRIGMDLCMPGERWSGVKGLRWIDSVADAIGPLLADVRVGWMVEGWQGRCSVMTEKNTTCTGRRKLQRRPLARYCSGIVQQTRSAATASEVLCVSLTCGSGRGKVATRRRVRMPAVR
jgi:hypothetical protein